MTDVKRTHLSAEERRDRPHRPLAFPAPEIESLNDDERHALRWARDACACDVRSVRTLRGASYALLLRCVSLSGAIYHEVDGFGSRDELYARLARPGVTDRVPVGAYDVEGRRPLPLEDLLRAAG
jgi:hypothetical protein